MRKTKLVFQRGRELYQCFRKTKWEKRDGMTLGLCPSSGPRQSASADRNVETKRTNRFLIPCNLKSLGREGQKDTLLPSLPCAVLPSSSSHPQWRLILLLEQPGKSMFCSLDPSPAHQDLALC